MRTATTSPEAAVRAATTHTAASRPARSATRPASRAPDGEAGVAPQPVDADRGGPPAGVGDVADRGQQGRVDHGGADPEQDRAGRPGQEAAGQGDAGQRDGLEQHAGGDEGLAAQPVRQGAGEELAEAPDGRIQRRQQADLGDGEAAADKQQRQQPPGEAVVEVVDQPGLAAGRQGRLPQAGSGQRPRGWTAVQRRLQPAFGWGRGWRRLCGSASVSWASSWACPRVSRTSSVDSPRPRPA